MASTEALPPPTHRLDDQPTNLISSSDTNWLLNGANDEEDVKVPSQPQNGVGTNGTNGAAKETPTVIPPLQPESQVIKNNKGVPW